MVDIITYCIIGGILSVASSITSNLASDFIFNILKPKIFKNKDKSEIKNTLQEIANKLKADNREEWKILQEKIDDIATKTLEFYEDFPERKMEIVNLLTQNLDGTRQISQAVDELKGLILEYDLKRPYILLKRGEISEKLQITLRPPLDITPVERKRLKHFLTSNTNLFIIGRPGIGKTFFLREIVKERNPEQILWVNSSFLESDITRLLRENLLENVLVIWDDIQNNPENFYKGMLKLSEQCGYLTIICAARSTELNRVDEIPVSFWSDFKFKEVKIPLFSHEERRKLIKNCSNTTTIGIDDDVADELAEKSDGTPLYIISVFLNERFKEVGKILMGDIEELPGDVVELWRGYFNLLPSHEKAFIRWLMILSKIDIGGIAPLVKKLYEFGGNSFSEYCDAQEALKKKFWIVRTDSMFECHDVQLEAIPSEEEMLSQLKTFLGNEKIDIYLTHRICFGISGYHYAKISKTRTFAERIQHVIESINFINISVDICKQLEKYDGLSMSLNNGANLYSELAALQQTREERLESIQKAVEYIEEAIEIRRDLGLTFDIAHSLAISVFIYIEYLDFNEVVFTQLLQNCDEAIGIFKAFNLPFKYCPLLQIGIKIHRIAYERTRSDSHLKRINEYEILLQNCEKK